ncbi:IPT/TIG domain-containing protein [Ureibacillus terrenus]|uniref:IPT/TIG domain-containing protein n=2 Tax=Ureibacillus terrenus TaxID=118246 RepID=A0A540V2A4_9BACL|nr:IPT/TIG domain-containing protein [Ureibacillus terrenus]MED3764156.1 hypothetical protein [Ureibacillus terrenus]TQE90890.1 hypothetical protein FKZ59_07735 [Ureibacillus terrenus]
MKKRRLRAFFISLSIIFVLAGCTQSGEESKNKDEQASASAEEKNVNLIGKVTLSKSSGRIGDEVAITAESLKPEKPLKVVWVDMEGSYQIEDNYSFIGAAYEPAEKVVAEGKADADGKWAGTFSIPDGFGDDHDILVYQDDEVVAKANFFVETVFTISPTSGPPGTEVTIKGEGLSWKMYGSLWHVNWDNKYTGMITAVTTNGKAVAVFRAAGKKGLHSITVESGASGFPYLSRDSSAINYIHTHYFTFEITSDEPVTTASYVEKAPEAADGGIQMPEPKNKDGVKVALDRPEGTVGEKVVLTASGLPKNEKVSFDWHTMVGTRVTKEGYGPEIFDLGEAETDDKGNLTYEFAIPDDLGGLPHLIDVKVGDEVYGQAYLRILPSIVSVSPSSGPVGTEFEVTIKGSGWTEFDNALAVLYNNSYIGYVCGFNSQGTVKLKLVATGEPGYQFIDIYPSIYKGQQVQPTYYLRPMLTYRNDHPGTGIPAIRAMFEITE